MLTEEEIGKIESKDRISCKKVGDNLFIKVHPNGKKYWQLKYYNGQRERRISLGEFPQVSLGEALAKAKEISLGNTIDQSSPQIDLMELSNLLDLQLDTVDAIAETSKRLDNIEQSIANLFDQLTQLINDSAKPIAQVSDKPIEQPITKSIPEASPKPIEGPPSLPCHKPPPNIPNLKGSFPAKRQPNHFEPGCEPKW